ncbi:MAG: hypothetical protein A3K68_02135 [Euryarchaeota archaeon RBG_16_68_13]|nr:MAG: hypothetical protein A3K68_02135 [Euryarchaeota archaeon RBG_16_68_13]
MPHPVYLLIALSLVSSAGIGAVLVASDDAPELTTFEGTVLHAAWNPHFEIAVAFEVRNASANVTYTVELGPPWWWSAVGLPEIHVNDTLRVEGVLENESEIQAYTIWINGGDAFVIREAGKPGWAEMASGRPDEE